MFFGAARKRQSILIKKKKTDKNFFICYFLAIRFFQRYGNQFKHSHRGVLEDLRNVKSFDSKKSKKPVVNQFRTCKLRLVISSYSHRLLLSFLKDSRLTLVLKTINQRVSFDSNFFFITIKSFFTHDFLNRIVRKRGNNSH